MRHMELIGQRGLLMPVTMVMMIGGAMISDKDDQASSCSGRLLGGRDHMRGELMQTHQAAFLGLGHTRATPAARAVRLDSSAKWFFLCCPSPPLIGFQRRLVEIGKIAHPHHQPPPSSPICFCRQATRSPSRAENVSVCRWHVVVSQVKGEYPSRWPTRSGRVGNKTPDLVAATVASATDAPCGYAL
jgi:hypothetical protein